MVCGVRVEEPADPFVPLLEKHAGLARSGAGYVEQVRARSRGRRVRQEALLRPELLRHRGLRRHAAAADDDAGRARRSAQPSTSAATAATTSRGAARTTRRSAGQLRLVRRRRLRRQQPAVDQLRVQRARLLERPQRLAVVADPRRRREPRLGQRQPHARRVADRRQVQEPSTRRVFPEYPLPRRAWTRSPRSRRASRPTARCKLDGDTRARRVPRRRHGHVLAAVPARGAAGLRRVRSARRCATWGSRRSDPAAVQATRGTACRSPISCSSTRIYVNFAKAIAAYEYTLISKNSPFDSGPTPASRDGHARRRRPSAARTCSSARPRAPSATPGRCSPTTSSTRSACRSSARTCRRRPSAPQAAGATA